MRLFEIDGNAVVSVGLVQQGGALGDMAWSPDGSRLATAGDQIKLWTAGGESVTSFGTLFARYTAVTWSDDGNRVAATTVGGKSEVWNPATKARESVFQTGTVASLRWRGDLLTTLGPANQPSDGVRVWNPATGTISADVVSLVAPAMAIDFHPALPILAIGTSDGSVFLWDRPPGSTRPR